MKILICGGRSFGELTFSDGTPNPNFKTERQLFVQALKEVTDRVDVTDVIHGAAQGADRLAEVWARHTGIKQTPYPADWRTYGKAGGPLRNAKMLRENPDIELVIAFPQEGLANKGTYGMIRLAHGIEVRVVRHDGTTIIDRSSDNANSSEK